MDMLYGLFRGRERFLLWLRSHSWRPKNNYISIFYKKIWIFIQYPTEFLFYFWPSKSWIWILVRILIHQSLNQDLDSLNMDPQHRVRPSNLPPVSRRWWKNAWLKQASDQIWLGAFGYCRIVPRRTRIVVYHTLAPPPQNTVEAKDGEKRRSVSRWEKP